jgi:hypothetical protein
MAGSQFRIVRKVATVPVVPGNFATIDMPRSYDLESVILRVSGTVNVTTIATAVRIEAPTQIITRAELTSDGKNNLCNAPFWALCLGKHDRPNMGDVASGIVTPPSGVAVASYFVEATGIIDQCFIDGVRPKDSNFRTQGLQLFQLRLSFGQPGDLFVGGVATYTNMNVEISVSELVELPDPKEGTVTNPIALRKVSYQEIALLATNPNQELRLPAGNLIKSILVRTAGSVTADEPSATILNNIQAASGVDVKLNTSGPTLRRKNTSDFGKFLPGYYVHDFSQRGEAQKNITEFWDVVNQTEPKIVVDVNGGATNKLQIVTTEFIMATPKA